MSDDEVSAGPVPLSYRVWAVAVLAASVAIAVVLGLTAPLTPGTIMGVVLLPAAGLMTARHLRSPGREEEGR